MELWKETAIVLGVVGALYGFCGLIPPLIMMGGWLFQKTSLDPVAVGIINLIFMAFFSPSMLTFVAVTSFREKLIGFPHPILAYFDLIINAIVWSLIFAFLGVKLGKFIEKRRTKAEQEK